MLVTRTATFDSGHRVINERMKCFNLHGHTYTVHVTFECPHLEQIGYAIDFKEIKRIGMQWIDDYLDHAFIANPHDKTYIEAAQKEGSKLWVMSLNGDGKFCNPTAENLAIEIAIVLTKLFETFEPKLYVDNIVLYETPNCKVQVKRGIDYGDRRDDNNDPSLLIKTHNVLSSHLPWNRDLSVRWHLEDYLASKGGWYEYDCTKIKQ